MLWANSKNSADRDYAIAPVDRSRDEVSRVAVDLTNLKSLYCGLGQFSYYLGRALARASQAAVAPELFVPYGVRELMSDVPLPKIAAFPWMKEQIHRYYRPWLARLMPRTPRYALWHATTQNTRYLPLDERIPVVLTIHDLNFLREKPPEVWHRKLRGVQALVDRAVAVTTISKFVAEEVRSHLDLGEKPLRIIYNGLIATNHPEADRPAFADGSPFLFSIGDVLRKKNFHVLIDLMTRLPQYHLIIAGNDRSAYANEIRRLAAKAGVSDRVVLPGIVSDATRYWLYKNCAAFLFPSLTEGFGLPVIEAMRFGKPVFLSNATSLPEIGGPLAFYWTSFDGSAMFDVFRAGMASFAGDPSYPAQLAARANQFSWDQAAAEYLAYYQEIIEGTATRSMRVAA
ncbi:MAG: glycosyltransferase family 1 protein [Planctomycetota bacterium]